MSVSDLVRSESAPPLRFELGTGHVGYYTCCASQEKISKIGFIVLCLVTFWPIHGSIPGPATLSLPCIVYCFYFSD